MEQAVVVDGIGQVDAGQFGADGAGQWFDAHVGKLVESRTSRIADDDRGFAFRDSDERLFHNRPRIDLPARHAGTRASHA